MNDIDLINFLQAKQLFLNSYIKDYNNEDLVQLKNDIFQLNKLIENILTDISQKLIPESFYSRIINDWERNLPYTSLNKIEPQLFEQINKAIHSSLNLIEIYSVFKALNFAQSNTVLVGANGCGKTSLVNFLKISLNEKDSVVIPAQKLLFMPTFSHIPNFYEAKQIFNAYQDSIPNDKITFQPKEMNDFEYNHTKCYGSEMVKIIGYLLSEKQYKANILQKNYETNSFIDIDQDNVSYTLKGVIDIWNDLIKHRTLFCDDYNSLKIKYKNENNIDSEYDAHGMSDGERVIIYLVSRVLLAPPQALIIVDEPEIYLHKAISNKLWDKLEYKRKDCTFIYLTHDLDFASSRIASKGWIKNYRFPDYWEIELLKDNTIPEDLLLKLYGSQRKILFCEGNKSKSWDKQVYEILFPQFTIEPVGSCKNVIAYTKAFNSLNNSPVKAYGLIDHDYREDDTLKELKKESIYSFSVAEIENLFLIEEFIERYAQYKHEENFDINHIKSKIITQISNKKDDQILSYLTSRINQQLHEYNLDKDTTKEEIIIHLKDISRLIDAEKIYNDRKTKIDNLLKENKYNELIQIVNDKGLITQVAKEFNYAKGKDYIEKAISFLKNDENGRIILRHYFPEELTKEN